MRRYRPGFRFGERKALAVVRPGTVSEQWKVLEACNAASVIAITLASNTGLTGGSTPDGNNYDRGIVIVSTSRMKKVYVIEQGKQIVCLPGATPDQLEHVFKPLGRKPHSVVGSSCIGASVFGGVCINSGGAPVRRGPAYTQMAVFAQVDAAGMLQLVNHLGILLGDTPEDVLRHLDRGEFPEVDIQPETGAASDRNYVTHVREIDADTPARFNADPHRLYEVSGTAGKPMVFAERPDTFPIEQDAKVFYIDMNRPEALTDIRRHALHEFTHLPISGEYLHRDAFDIAKKCGKDTFLTIHYLGTSRLPALFALKNRFDPFFDRLGFLPSNFTDRVMQAMSGLFPSHLPPRMKEYRNKYEHHMLLEVPAEGVPETNAFLEGYFAKASGGYFECSDEERNKAFLRRFAAAGAAVCYHTVHRKEIENIVALDIALRRNDRDWREKLLPKIDQAISIKIYYGHFLFHVFHQNYIVKKGNDCLELEHKMWKLLDHHGGEYPAEHNVGHLYRAKPTLAAFYQGLDPIRDLIHVTASIPESGKCRSSPNIARLLAN